MGNNKRQMSGIITMLRVCTILLAAVSFWATAQGMMEYTFPKSWQAYAASLGIQGLLLGLNFALPKFLEKSKGWWKKAILLGMTLVLLFCSSWFSYLYIAGQAYGKSWDTECRILAQSIYRDELFRADTYAEHYGAQLENELADQIIALYDQASKMEQSAVTVNQQINWDNERTNANGSSARDLLNTAIDAASSAMAEDATQNVREQASSALTGIQASLQSELDRIDTQLQRASSEVATTEASLQSAQRRLANAPADVDTTPLLNAVNTAAQNYNRAISRQNELGQQRDDYERAEQRVSYYMLILGMTEDGVNTYFVGENLREIQKELFQTAPDSNRMMALATEIFDRLQSGVDLGASENTDSVYQSFLSSMNRFIHNIDNYRSIKETSAALKDTIRQLSDGIILSLRAEAELPPSVEPTNEPSAMPTDGEPILESAPPGEEENSSPAPDVSEPPSVQPQDNLEPSQSLEDDANAPPKENDAPDSAWKDTWVYEFNNLKAKIAGLPIYTLADNGEDAAISTELSAYDRAASTKNLDEAIRLYLSDHNAAQEGIIYLTSPYWHIALFSLIVALLLDLSAFITGVIIDRVTPSEDNAPTKANSSDTTAPPTDLDDWWTIYPGMNRYTFLTGDFMCLDDIITYKTIENGKEDDIEYQDLNMGTGFYVWQGKKMIKVSKQSGLLFRGVPEGPRDGIYRDCSINYDQGLLMVTQNGTSEFVGTASTNTPVYHFGNGFFDVLPAEKLDHEKGYIIVVALNQEGTKIIAIYIISEAPVPPKE